MMYNYYIPTYNDVYKNILLILCKVLLSFHEHFSAAYITYNYIQNKFQLLCHTELEIYIYFVFLYLHNNAYHHLK